MTDYGTPPDLSPWAGLGYVALGSSYASGPGIEPLVATRPAEAAQSERNYAHLVARAANLELTDVTSAGATIDDLLTREQHGQPPQIEAITGDTALVTVTIGGNDIGLTQYLMAHSLPTWLRGFANLDDAGNADLVRQKLEAVGPRLVELIATIKERAPRATVLMVNYLAIMPPHGNDLRRTYYDLAWRLADATARAAEKADARLIDLRTASLPHHCEAAEPWCTGPKLSILPWNRSGASPCHPNASGMVAAASLILADLGAHLPHQNR